MIKGGINNDMPCSGNYGDSCNKNDKCRYPICKTPKQILKDIIKADIRKGERIPDDNFNKFMKATEEVDLVCLDCARDRNASPPKNHCYTIYPQICGICNKEKDKVTEPRDFGLHRYKLRILK